MAAAHPSLLAAPWLAAAALEDTVVRLGRTRRGGSLGWLAAMRPGIGRGQTLWLLLATLLAVAPGVARA